MDIEKLKAWAESPAADTYFENLRLKDEIEQTRFKRFEEWLKDNDFDELMNRLILEHDDDYIDKCYRNGCMPYPTNKMQFVFDYVTEYAGTVVEVEEFECNFPHQEWEFHDYYFGVMWGQGAVITIWNKDDKKKIFGL